jgi:hypothetical protein
MVPPTKKWFSLNSKYDRGVFACRFLFCWNFPAFYPDREQRPRLALMVARAIYLIDLGRCVLASLKTDVPKRTQANLIFLALFGVLSTLLNVGLLRFEPILAGSEFGARNLSARKAYTTILQTLPSDIVVQYNPSSYVNRPAGLYGMRQSAISDRTAYGISTEIFLERVATVGGIFTLDAIPNWQPVDDLCEQYFIDVLVIENTDPLWKSIDVLKADRQPHYLDDTFAVFSCGSFAASPSP